MAAVAAQRNAVRLSVAVSKLPVPVNGNPGGFPIVRIDGIVKSRINQYVIPAEAGISSLTNCNNYNLEIPASAGMTEINEF